MSNIRLIHHLFVIRNKFECATFCSHEIRKYSYDYIEFIFCCVKYLTRFKEIGNSCMPDMLSE